jgi:branched-chain amino acid transport system substrate-binding protein
MRHDDKKTLFLSAVLGAVMLVGITIYMQNQPELTTKIGFAAGLSGIKSELGVSGRNGARIAVDRINRQGGINGHSVELVAVDDQNDSRVSLDVDRRLARMGVRVIVGHMVSGVAEPTVVHANENKVLLISPTIATEELTGIDDNFLRIIASNMVQGRSLALAAIQETLTRKVGIVYDKKNESFAKPIITAFKEATEPMGMQVFTPQSFDGQRDFRKIIESLKRNGAESVLLIASALEAGMFGQQCRKHGLKVQMFCPMWTMTNDFLQVGGEDVEGALLVSQVDLNDQTPSYKMFRETYKQRFGEEPTFASVLSYDATLVAAFGIKAAENQSADKIKAAILRQAKFQGLQGQIEIDGFGDMRCNYTLYRVQNGAFQKVRKL